MNRLSYPRKFALISLLFAIPLSWVIYQLNAEMNQSVKFARKELQGIEYLRPLRKLRVEVAESQLLVRQERDASSNPPPDLSRLHDLIESDFQDLAAVDRRLGPVLEASNRFAMLSQKWQRFASKPGDSRRKNPIHCIRCCWWRSAI